MRHAVVAVLAALVLAGSVGAAGAGDSGSGTVADLLERADAHRDAGRLEAQREVARRALAQAPEDAAALVTLARAHFDLGNAARGESRTRHYEDAVGFARRAAELAPEFARAHLWVAISVGQLALSRRGAAKLALSREVRHAAERTLEIDPDEADALHVLARWHYEAARLAWWERLGAAALGGLPEASLDEAARLLERAIVLEPDESIRHRLLLARVHLEAGRKAAARAELEILLALPPADLDDPARQAEARALLAQR